MILIADSGSTKTEWCVTDGGKPVKTVRTAGMNPYFQTKEEMETEIRQVLCPAVRSCPIEAIYFYGAGCAFPEQNRLLEAALHACWPVPVEVFSDLMAAARSLCGHKPGIACILGTGSNSCLYDGTEIISHVPPLGYILGDEGSGAALGKQLAADCLKGQLPASLCRKFMERFGLTQASLLERVYKQPFPNRFLAGLSPFLLENITEQPVYNLVYDAFRRFFFRNILAYEGCETFPIHFTGSIAYHYREVLRAAAVSLQLTLGDVEKTPMPGLIRYHARKNCLNKRNDDI